MAAVPTPGIEIVDYPKDISVERGWAKYPVIKVKNTGETELYNVKLSVVGIPSVWVNIEPEIISKLSINETKQFKLKITVPTNAKQGEYTISLIASSNKTTDKKSFILAVFASKEDLIAYELRKLKVEVENFEIEVQMAKKDGKDVTEVLKVLDEIKNQINNSEEYLNEKRYDEALASIYTGWSLLKRARELLAKAPYIIPVFIPVLPKWATPLMLILLVIIIILLAFAGKIKRRMDRIIKHMKFPEAKNIVKMMKKEVEAGIRVSERERLIKAMNLIDEEHKQGLLSDTAYEELRRSYERKLKAIEES